MNKSDPVGGTPSKVPHHNLPSNDKGKLGGKEVTHTKTNIPKGIVKAQQDALRKKQEPQPQPRVPKDNVSGLKIVTEELESKEPKVLYVLGQTKQNKAQIEVAVKAHREPKKQDGTVFTGKEADDLSLTKIRDEYVKNEEAKYLQVNNIAKTDFDDINKYPQKPRLLSKWKEEGNTEAYKKVQDRIDKGLYNPAAIAHEIKKDLGVTDAIPAGISDAKTAMDAIKDELNNFQKGLIKKGVLTNELRKHLEKDIEKTMKAYLEVYPEKSPLEAFVFCRDLGRNAIYQLLHDKHAFTGSDHGVLHIHHNCRNGDEMHNNMDKNDMSSKAKLLSRVMHFYHDIGYSVGSGTHFAVMKDHPFIGAKFIDSNKEYFDHFLDPDATTILKESILHHAVVSFDSNTKEDLSMVRFTTSNSDACAVTADQKTQSFWREHPETLISLARLRQFLTIYPEMGSKLSNAKIVNKPEEVLTLKQGVDSKRFSDKQKPLTENDFVDPLEFKAWTVFSTVRAELMAIVETVSLPNEEKEAFKKAIEENFNAFSGDIVLGQYGAELNKVSVVKNPKTGINDPKYLPAIDLSPSILFAFLESCYSRETAGKNITKVCNEEYAADKGKISEALEEVSKAGVNNVVVESPVAHITISKKAAAPPEMKPREMSQVRLKPAEIPKEHEEMDIHGKKLFHNRLKKVEHQLVKLQKSFIPYNTRKALNDVVKTIGDISNAKDAAEFTIGLQKLDDEFAKLDSRLAAPYDKKVSDITHKARKWIIQLNTDPKSWTDAEKEQFAKIIIEMRTACTTDAEWDFMRVSK